jgi:hypothetical protein
MPNTSGGPSPDEIRAEIDQRQRALANTVDELTSRANPKTLVAQGRDEAVTRARVERLVAAGAAVVVLVALFVAARRRSRRG